MTTQRSRRLGASFTALTLLALPVVSGALTGCSAAPSSTDGSSAVDSVSPELIAAAKTNLIKLSAEIDKNHLSSYKLSGDLPSQFIDALQLEFANDPTLLAARLRAIASVVIFSAPDVTTDPQLGRITPFHGMTTANFQSLMMNEDFVFNSHVSANGGSTQGVRPFSVCETTYLIKISKGEISDPTFTSGSNLTNYDAYAHAYQKFAADTSNCAQRDLDEWYNFRGLGALRPTWLESNISERFVRRMASACQGTIDPSMADACKGYASARLAYRERKNTEFALREVYYDPSPSAMIGGETADAYMTDSNNAGVFVEDRNSDGIAEWLAPGPTKLQDGAVVDVSSAQIAQVDIKVRVSSKGTLQTTAGPHPVSAGEILTLPAGSTVAIYNVAIPSTGAVSIDTSTSLRLPLGTNVVLADGTAAHVPQSFEVVAPAKAATLSVTSQTAISLPLGTGARTLSISGGGTSQFAANLSVDIPLASGSSLQATVAPGMLDAIEGSDPKWDKAYASTPDLGLLEIFKDGSKCNGATADLVNCPILRRFASLIDRHENFYQTYSSLDPTSANISQQPSPLVACSITLAAANQWAYAGSTDGNQAGLIFLTRIPFAEILTGDIRSIDTLGRLKDANGDGKADNDLKAGPSVLRVQDIYAGKAKLDMSKVWLDIATLSHNQYQGEHEVSKYGTVPAEQIEGLLVVGNPVNLNGGSP